MVAIKLFVSTLCIAALGSLGLSAQSAPDFSGTWTMDPSRSEAAAHGEPIGPVTVVIRQAPGEVQIETTQNGTAQAVRYLPEGTSPTVADEPLGTFRYLLFEAFVTETNDDWGHTFFSEIDVIRQPEAKP